MRFLNHNSVLASYWQPVQNPVIPGGARNLALKVEVLRDSSLAWLGTACGSSE